MIKSKSTDAHIILGYPTRLTGADSQQQKCSLAHFLLCHWHGNNCMAAKEFMGSACIPMTLAQFIINTEVVPLKFVIMHL